MKRTIKVKKTLGKKSVLIIVERNTNVANQIANHAVIVSPPHTKAAILIVTAKVMEYYTLHLKGDHEATDKMYEQLDILAGYYWDMAEYTEVIANETNDAVLPIGMGFELYAPRKQSVKKELVAADGSFANEVVLTYPKYAKAGAYRAELALVVEGEEADFKHKSSCSITEMILRNVPSDTKLLIRLFGIFADGERLIYKTIPFRTKDWS